MQLVREGSAGRVGTSPDQEKGTDELLPTERERTIPDLQLKKSRTLSESNSKIVREASLDDQPRVAT